ncbi:hypothetical protein [uncultured Corynebacterium sp.]|nr:hypothetical protein [uncultured Corynebacterium sp.]MCG7295808.1 hypothetical protein [Corynebacterium afermentans]
MARRLGIGRTTLYKYLTEGSCWTTAFS